MVKITAEATETGGRKRPKKRCSNNRNRAGRVKKDSNGNSRSDRNNTKGRLKRMTNSRSRAGRQGLKAAVARTAGKKEKAEEVQQQQEQDGKGEKRQ